MSEIVDKETGIRVRFVKGWDIIPDQNPHALSLLVCPDCLQQLIGTGTTLRESMAAADDLARAHACSHLKAQE